MLIFAFLTLIQIDLNYSEGIKEIHTGQLIVHPLQSDISRERALNIINNYETIRKIEQLDLHVIKVPQGIYEEDLIKDLMSTGLFAYVENDMIVSPTATIPNDTDYGLQWHHATLNSPEAWDITTGDSSFIVTTVDVGIDVNHPDLVDNLIPGYNSSSGVLEINGGDMSPTQADHGTATMGLMGATGNNLLGGTGMAWNISMMPVRATNYRNQAFMSALLDGAVWACDNGARVVSMSWHGGWSSGVKQTGQYLKDNNSLLVWATGNYGILMTGHDSPSVIFVGATKQNDTKSDFSIYGEMVDVVAPGSAIYLPKDNGGYRTWSGTSFATPIVGGILAMMMIVSPNSTAEQIENMMYLNCVDLCARRVNKKTGHGRPDFAACLNAALLAESTYTAHDTIELSINSNNVNPGEPVLLTWSKAPPNKRYRIIYSLVDTSPLIEAHENYGGTFLNPPKLIGAGMTNTSRGQLLRFAPPAASGKTFYIEMQCDDNGILRDSNTQPLTII